MSDISRLLGIDIDLSGQKSPPTPGKAPLDVETQQLIGQQIDKANRPSAAFTGELNQGVEQGVNRLAGLGAASQANTGVNQAQLNAIKNVYGAETGKALDQMKFQNQIEGERRRMMQYQTAAQLALHQQQVQTNYLQNLTDSYNQMEQQRAQFVSSISGLANTGMGMYAGSQRNQGFSNLMQQNQQNQAVNNFQSGNWQNMGSNTGMGENIA